MILPPGPSPVREPRAPGAARGDPLEDLQRHLAARALARILPLAGARVLDAAGGEYGERLAAAGYRVTVVASVPGEPRRARVRDASSPRVAWVTGASARLPLRDASVDFVLGEAGPGGVGAAAREVLRVLAPGGGFHLSCGNRWHDALALLASGATEAGLDCLARGASRDHAGAPAGALSPRELRALLAEAGAEDVVVEGRVCFAHLLPPSVRAALFADPRVAQRLRALEEGLALDPSVAGLASRLVATGRRPR